MTVINLPSTSGHKPAPATYHAPLVHFPPYNPELDFDLDDEDDIEDEPVQTATKPRSKPVSITIVPSMKPKRTRSRTRHTQSQPSSPRPSESFDAATLMQRRETIPAAGRPFLHHRGVSITSSNVSSPDELSTASSSPSSLPKGYFSTLHGRPAAQQPVQRKPSYLYKV